MGTEAMGYALGQQCAPVIAGVKPSNLLIVEKNNQHGLRHALRGTNLSSYLLYTSNAKDYWLLFEPELFGRALADDKNRQYLCDCGYDPEHISAVFVKLAERFRSYKEGKSEFPHEMGVFLGYPLQDVRGFIENRGQNFKKSGYWKVYDDVAYADRVFQLYEYVKEKALELCGQGVEIPEIWKHFRQNGSSHLMQRLCENVA